ncbi:MAG: peptide deformylase [Silvanigrellaceae bacterium]|nr:peptide deformylase [Silvanigrellaceae bacterium]
MTICYKILHYPHVLLRKKATPVEKFTSELKDFIKNFIETMHAFDGRGLAAPQVGISKRICVVHLGEKEKDESQEFLKDFKGSFRILKEEGGEEVSLDQFSSRVLVLINPEFLKMEEPAIFPFDGCLSLPEVDLARNTQRFKKVTVRFQDENGVKYLIESEHFLISTCIQHEIDHLNGTLYIDRAVKKDFTDNEVISEIEAFEADPAERKRMKKLKPIDARSFKFDFL